jgi:hypothetical protein
LLLQFLFTSSLMASPSAVSDETYALCLAAFDVADPASPEAHDRLRADFALAFALLKAYKANVIAAASDEDRAVEIEKCIERMVSLVAALACRCCADHRLRLLLRKF